MNHGISFLLDGETWTPKDPNGNKLTPISYKGTTYVPLKSVAEAAGVDVEYEAAKQQISLNTKTSSTTISTGERVPFSVDNVSHFLIDLDKSGITRNRAELLFGEVQYETAFTVTKVNVAGADFGFNVKKGTKRIGVLIGYHANEEDLDFKRTARYSIMDSKGQSLAAGSITDGAVVSNEIVIPNNETVFTVNFESGATSSTGTGYMIWDESWLEF
ncbi:hypothetical protein PNBC_08060 [Paenibacillus crassostreae]|uniref:Copper amine oxidase-like N-terminal domain-containing protein n=1 Tax=Paenibacillus crassostreae TaxID=1763538 RepID=A0A167EKP0_9BACL|nr:hypothetical protein LPB68_21770 [Paenibacillus crassostreae]OAB75636.1 hypothetical protein PNBC_08060 [Paenibacillus crassostreae]